MPEVFCNTSPLQYLHQLKHLHLLPRLAGKVVVPPAVFDELTVGRKNGVDLPDVAALGWVSNRPPSSLPVFPLGADLGPGETQVLALASEQPGCTVILDDALARRVAESMSVRLTGTLGVLLSAKRAGLVLSVRPLLEELDRLRFRVSARTRTAVLKLAGEAD